MNCLLLSAMLVIGCGGIPNFSAFAVVGDSISAGYFGVPSDFANAWPATTSAIIGRPNVNVSVFGGQVSDMIAHEVPLIPPDITTVVYEGGTNDTFWGPKPVVSGTPGRGLTSDQVLALLDDMVAAIHAQAPYAQIVFLDVRRYGGMTHDADPVSYDLVTAWNAREKVLGPTLDVQDVDFSGYNANGLQTFPDGVHPTQAEAVLYGQMMAPLLR